MKKRILITIIVLVPIVVILLINYKTHTIDDIINKYRSEKAEKLRISKLSKIGKIYDLYKKGITNFISTNNVRGELIEVINFEDYEFFTNILPYYRETTNYIYDGYNNTDMVMLLRAVSKNNLDIVKTLIEKMGINYNNALISTEYKISYYLFDAALVYSDVEVIEYLYKLGAKSSYEKYQYTERMLENRNSIKLIKYFVNKYDFYKSEKVVQQAGGAEK